MKASTAFQFADEQDAHRPWDVRTTAPAGKGEASSSTSKPQVELVGISARTPWQVKDDGAGTPPPSSSRRGKKAPVARTEEEDDGEKPPSGKRSRLLTDEEDAEVRRAVLAVRRARAVAESKRAAGGREEDWDLPAHSKAAGAKRARWGAEQGQPREICLRNYAAVGAGDAAADEREGESGGVERGHKAAVRPGYRYYGLIDQGVAQDGVRCLIMHAPPRSTPGDTATDRVRPGSVLRVHSTALNGVKGRLRVRFTTPERYYAPGTRVSTLRIGVDASDWASLTPGV